MTVREFIEKLLVSNPDAEVLLDNSQQNESGFYTITDATRIVREDGEFVLIESNYNRRLP